MFNFDAEIANLKNLSIEKETLHGTGKSPIEIGNYFLNKFGELLIKLDAPIATARHLPAGEKIKLDELMSLVENHLQGPFGDYVKDSPELLNINRKFAQHKRKLAILKSLQARAPITQPSTTPPPTALLTNATIFHDRALPAAAAPLPSIANSVVFDRATTGTLPAPASISFAATDNASPFLKRKATDKAVGLAADHSEDTVSASAKKKNKQDGKAPAAVHSKDEDNTDGGVLEWGGLDTYVNFFAEDVAPTEAKAKPRAAAANLGESKTESRLMTSTTKPLTAEEQNTSLTKPGALAIPEFNALEFVPEPKVFLPEFLVDPVADPFAFPFAAEPIEEMHLLRRLQFDEKTQQAVLTKHKELLNAPDGSHFECQATVLFFKNKTTPLLPVFRDDAEADAYLRKRGLHVRAEADPMLFLLRDSLHFYRDKKELTTEEEFARSKRLLKEMQAFRAGKQDVDTLFKVGCTRICFVKEGTMTRFVILTSPNIVPYLAEARLSMSVAQRGPTPNIDVPNTSLYLLKRLLFIEDGQRAIRKYYDDILETRKPGDCHIMGGTVLVTRKREGAKGIVSIMPAYENEIEADTYFKFMGLETPTETDNWQRFFFAESLHHIHFDKNTTPEQRDAQAIKFKQETEAFRNSSPSSPEDFKTPFKVGYGFIVFGVSMKGEIIVSIFPSYNLLELGTHINKKIEKEIFSIEELTALMAARVATATRPALAAAAPAAPPRTFPSSAMARPLVALSAVAAPPPRAPAKAVTLVSLPAAASTPASASPSPSTPVPR